MRLRTGEAGQPRPVRSVADLRAAVAAALAAEAGSSPPPVPPGRWTLLSARQADLILAMASCALAAPLAVTRHWPADALLGVGIAVPLAWLRRRPLTAAGFSLAAAIGYSAVARPVDPLNGLPPTGFLVVIPLVTAIVCPLPRAITALAGCLAGGALAVLADPAATFNVFSGPPAAAFIAGFWAAGRVLRQGGQMLAAHAEATIRIDAEQAGLTSRALAMERTRVARELHDAVGHAMTIVVLQATAARRVWASDPDLAHEHVSVVRATITQTLDELRLLVMALAIGSTEPDGNASGVTRLAERAVACGLAVEVRTDGEPAGLPAVVGHALYRITQEAITNAARHAPGATIGIGIRYGPGDVTLEVANAMASRATPALPGSGTGIQGMRERAAECGGTLEAEPQPAGGFAVRACLPCQREHP